MKQARGCRAHRACRRTAGGSLSVAEHRLTAELKALRVEVITDLRWWLKHLSTSWRGTFVLATECAHPIMIKSDASGELGSGYYQLRDDGASPAWATWKWTPEQLTKWKHDMVTKELFPLVRAVEINGAQWFGRLLKAGADNQGCHATA